MKAYILTARFRSIIERIFRVNSTRQIYYEKLAIRFEKYTCDEVLIKKLCRYYFFNLTPDTVLHVELKVMDLVCFRSKNHYSTFHKMYTPLY